MLAMKKKGSFGTDDGILSFLKSKDAQKQLKT